MNYRSAFAPLLHALAILLLQFGQISVVAAESVGAAAVSRHPLEFRALTDPKGVLNDLPALIQSATAAKDFKELALLYLAESNACRVIADWPCQSSAAARARAAAESAKLPELQARGYILESRGRMATQDFSRAGQLLRDAEKMLSVYPFPELSADVFLAYSSLSYTVGKHSLAAEYAERGLTALGDRPSLVIRVRLLRNKARALGQLNDAAGARAVLKQAIELADQVHDPKLSAELYLEGARIARLANDIPTQVKNGRQILALETQLSNSQLFGLGHEVLGLAALNASDNATAERELRQAYSSFQELKLERDERRVLRALVRSVLGRGLARGDLEKLVARSIALEAAIEADDRNMAADDFEARLKYAQQELDVQRLEASAMLAAQRATALADQQRLTLIVAVLSIGLLLVFGVLFFLQRRFNTRLAQVFARVRESESRYRMLADNSRDLVVRMRLDGQRLYVSPASKDMLGMDPAALTEPGWDLVHPDDRDMLAAAIQQLGAAGGSSTIAYRAKHVDGSYVWIEALARLIAKPEGGGPPEIVYSGRDITARVRAEQALLASEHNMRAITDNLPAMIARIDNEQRFTFANAFIGRVLGVATESMIGKTMLEVRGEKIYGEIQHHVAAALRGEAASFEGTANVGERLYYFQSNYIPDRDAGGNVQGFYALTFDITDLKLAEAKLDRLARIDSLTGVANRRHFEEQLAAAIARSHRQNTALALLWLDIDHFKSINDNHGHPAGDAVIRIFAERLRACVREDDMVARLGGDEFVVLIENAAPEAVENVAQKLLGIMQQPISTGDKKLHVAASIGVAYSAHAESSEQLMHLADHALYAAKGAGRNTYRTANGS
ncbi:MAG: diguanylate cyclase [Burkholderiales bacterium]|nr:diguanylate cyclase [Burkholderiales bacterium]